MKQTKVHFPYSLMFYHDAPPPPQNTALAVVTMSIENIYSCRLQ